MVYPASAPERGQKRNTGLQIPVAGVARPPVCPGKGAEPFRTRKRQTKTGRDAERHDLPLFRHADHVVAAADVARGHQTGGQHAFPRPVRAEHQHGPRILRSLSASRILRTRRNKAYRRPVQTKQRGRGRAKSRDQIDGKTAQRARGRRLPPAFGRSRVRTNVEGRIAMRRACRIIAACMEKRLQPVAPVGHAADRQEGIDVGRTFLPEWPGGKERARFRQKIRATDQPDRPRHALKMQIRDFRGRGDAERRIPRRRKPRAHGCREKPPELRRHVLSGCEGRLARDGLPGREGLLAYEGRLRREG